MIKYDANGITVEVVDANGAVQTSANPWDSAYTGLLTIMQQQLATHNANQAAQLKYMNDLQVYQNKLNMGITTATPPSKPMMVIVDDTGKSIQEPFNPPLPDPIPVKYAPANPSGALQPQNGPTIDQKLDMITNIVTAIAKKVLGV